MTLNLHWWELEAIKATKKWQKTFSQKRNNLVKDEKYLGIDKQY